MGGLTLNYIIRRVVIFLLTIWVSITIIFLVARLAPGDPISAMVAQASASMGVVENADAIIEGWKEYFGLNDPVHIQYIKFLGNLATLQFGPSLIAFPAQVGDLIGRALPWSIGLGMVTLPLIFFIGNLFGALLAWRRTPGGLRAIIPMTMIFTSLPLCTGGAGVHLRLRLSHEAVPDLRSIRAWHATGLLTWSSLPASSITASCRRPRWSSSPSASGRWACVA